MNATRWSMRWIRWGNLFWYVKLDNSYSYLNTFNEKDKTHDISSFSIWETKWYFQLEAGVIDPLPIDVNLDAKPDTPILRDPHIYDIQNLARKSRNVTGNQKQLLRRWYHFIGFLKRIMEFQKVQIIAPQRSLQKKEFEPKRAEQRVLSDLARTEQNTKGEQ